ncbi:hypothetical protein A2982_03440 [candidate division WWE3 bacterium RIFCSPLOWO2_01_FULL_39_13]|uniref:DNA alkylation repair protein n=1 Tax=candidate division WWE3 bacterium RIFCSPLOWO2_01_FULL_39_13 TaxID=1802624 RepID=A0A1F4V3C8_UNCKA|nr:MAG: hypothetical protein A2982_03440 [candidate division WWE3 bacterium RIFCSPLOWO2_01_FULL_39_13]
MLSEIFNKYHIELLNGLKKHIKKEGLQKPESGNKYIGTKRIYYNIKTEVINNLVKNWIKEHKNLGISEYTELLNSLFKGESHEESSLGGKLLGYLPKLRSELNPQAIDKWLDNADGWAEVDCICQANFTSKELLQKWIEWENLISKFSTDKNVHKKRASLVLLTKPARQSDDSRISKLAFKNIEKLKGEKDILITKAVSWLLRDLIKNHRRQVEDYLSKKGDSLSKIAVRETKKKLLTGRK